MRGGGDFPTETGSQSAGTIMVIDDEPALRSVLCTMLEVFGFSVIEAGSATFALSSLVPLAPREDRSDSPAGGPRPKTRRQAECAEPPALKAGRDVFPKIV